MSEERRIGTVAQTAAAFGTDTAGVFALIADGYLRTEREADGTLTVYRA